MSVKWSDSGRFSSYENATTTSADDTISLPNSFVKELKLCKAEGDKRAAVLLSDSGHSSEDETDTDWSSAGSNVGDKEEVSLEEEDSTNEDSGNETLVTEGSRVESSDEEEREQEICDENCYCNRLRFWLKEQASKNRCLLQDEYYLAQKEELWSHQGPIKDNAQCNYDPYPSVASESFRFAGQRDRLGRPCGRGTAYFPNGRKFIGHFSKGTRSGPGELFDREGGRILGGCYKNDQLNGICDIATNEGGYLEMVFDRGVAHGPARRYSPDGALQWTGYYRFGVPIGLCWRSNDAEGWLVGTCNRSGRMAGEDVVYLYPDLHTALVGKWDNDCLKKGRLAKLLRVEVKEGVLYPIVKEVPSDDVTYNLDVSGYSVISQTPMLRDPYESQLVVCKESLVSGGGEGLFALKSIPKKTVVSFYNGIRFHDCHAFNDWDYNSYKIRLNEKKKQILDIPPEHRDTKNYVASLAHKVNHSFYPNARFCDFAHPRFGRILCVKLTKDLEAGEEILCNYGYNLADCPQWYKDAHDSLFFDGQATIPLDQL